MEINALPQFCSTESFPLLEQTSLDSLIYGCGSAPPQVHPALSQCGPAVQNFTNWPLSNMNHSAYQQNAMLLQAQKGRITSARPMNMLAAHGFREVGVQNPQGEYLPQPKMPPRAPVVQQPPVAVQSTTFQNDWSQPKLCGDIELPGLDSDVTNHNNGILSADDDTTIINLGHYTNFGQDSTQDLLEDPSRRMSESSYSMSSNGRLADVSSFADFVSPGSQGQQDTDWPALLNTSSHPGMESPLAARSHQGEHFMRSSSRSCSSPVPNLRFSPYTLDSNRNKRWTTGMYAGHHGANAFQFNRYSSYYGSPLNPQVGFSAFTPDAMAPFQVQNHLFPANSQLSNAGMLFSSEDQFSDAAMRPLASQGLFRLLQSNTDQLAGCASHFADLSDPPDLFSSLHEEPCDPPEEDMNPTDPDMMPHEQELRFPGDLYTPKWVRGHGNKREGWCGLCKPGRWLVLKNSAFWYDKSFTHGVSAATGAAFQGPQETRRTDGNLDVWEGLCGSCGDWVALVSSKKKGTTWFRHAYKCHTHPKIKDGPKRRREVALNVPRSNELVGSGDHTITSTDDHTLLSLDGLPSKESRIIEFEDSQDVEALPMKQECKSDDETTPISTPQLTHTSLSTPQISTMQTPGSHYQPSLHDRKRSSVVFDGPVFSQSFASQLETFCENEADSTIDSILPSTPSNDKTTTCEPTTTAIVEMSELTSNHDSTITTNIEPFSLSNYDDHHFFPDTFTAHDSTNDVFTLSHMNEPQQSFDFNSLSSISQQAQGDFSRFASITDHGLDGAFTQSV